MTDTHILAPLSDSDIELSRKYPAVTSRNKLYLIQGNKVIGKVRWVSGLSGFGDRYYHVHIEPDDDATREFFKDDFTMPLFEKVVGLQYDGRVGRPMKHFMDEPDDRHKGTEIVDQVDFDFGIAHPRYASVEGWANATNRPKPSVRVPQKRRRSRNSNKIKKVA